MCLWMERCGSDDHQNLAALLFARLLWRCCTSFSIVYKGISFLNLSGLMISPALIRTSFWMRRLYESWVFHSLPTGMLIKASNCLALLNWYGRSLTQYFWANFLSLSSVSLIWMPRSLASWRCFLISSIFFCLMPSKRFCWASWRELSTPSPAQVPHPYFSVFFSTDFPIWFSTSSSFSFSNSSRASSA